MPPLWHSKDEGSHVIRGEHGSALIAAKMPAGVVDDLHEYAAAIGIEVAVRDEGSHPRAAIEPYAAGKMSFILLWPRRARQLNPPDRAILEHLTFGFQENRRGSGSHPDLGGWWLLSCHLRQGPSDGT